MSVTQIPIESLWAVETSFASQLTTALREGPQTASSNSRSVNAINRNGVAVIEVRGVLTKYPSLLQAVFGGAATTEIIDAFKAAIADPSIKAVCFVIDSPGGGVSGVPELADSVYAARKSGKQVVFHVDGLCASAMYHIASQGAKIFATHTTDRIGSIGTMLAIQDSSKAAAMAGVDVFVATTGELKAIGVPGVALTDSMKAYLQDVVEKAQAEFTTAVQRGRGLSAAKIKAVSDGAVFTANDAIALGLIDGVQSLEKTLAMLQGSMSIVQPKKDVKPTVVTAINPVTPASKSYLQQFRDGVEKLKATGVDNAKAVVQFVRNFPEIHQAMLAEMSGRPVKPLGIKLQGETGPALQKFRAGIAAIEATGVSRAQAVCQFVQQNPKAHQAMLEESRVSR